MQKGIWAQGLLAQGKAKPAFPQPELRFPAARGLQWFTDPSEAGSQEKTHVHFETEEDLNPEIKSLEFAIAWS